MYLFFMLKSCAVMQLFSFSASKYNIKEVKHLTLSNVIFYPCQYTNETFNLLLIGAGLVAFRV